MALISISQLIGKTFYVQKIIPYYDIISLNEKGDNAKPKGKLKINYSFVLDSYISPVPVAYKDKYYIYHSKLSDYYFTFKGSDGKTYAVKYANDGRFNTKKLKEQGVKTIEEERKEEAESKKTPIEKVSESVSDVFSGLSKTMKTILFIGVGVVAIGYLIPIIKKNK